MSPDVREGKVLAICSSQVHGYPTYPQEKVKVEMDGIVGDAHSGPLRESFRNHGTFKRNDRPISIVAQETVDEMNKMFGLHIKPGGFNEQLLVEGLGDLSDVRIGELVMLESGVELDVVDNAQPCVRLNAYHGEQLMAKKLVTKNAEGEQITKRGILANVLTPGVITLGESIKIFNPSVRSV